MTAGPAIEMWSKQRGKSSSPDGRTLSVTMQRAFTMTLAANDPLEAAFDAPGLPLVNDRYPGTQFIICRSLTPMRVSPTLAMITADYQGEAAPRDRNGSPISTVVKVSWGATTTEEEIDEDWFGRPIVTVNGEPIKGITERISDDVVTIERKFANINRYALRQYRRATNSDTFLGWPPGTARIIDETATATYVDGFAEYWDVRVSIQFREPFRTTPDKAWFKRVRHEGLWVRDVAGGKVHHAWDSLTKSKVSKPVLLKADGTKLDDDDYENAVWLEFQTLGSLPFSALGLTD